MGSLPDSKYIIQTDGYWFVEAHDVDSSKGHITVSAKGIANGLSSIPNDGADFGPDTYNPNYTGSGIPYTQTNGIQEAWDYAVNQNGLNIRLLRGEYGIESPFIGLFKRQSISIIGDFAYGGNPLDNNTVVYIKNKTQSSDITPFFQVASTDVPPGGLSLYMNNITFIGAGGSQSNDTIVTVNVVNEWDGVNTNNFGTGSNYAVRIIGSGNGALLSNGWFYGNNTVSGNAVIRIDGETSLSSYTIGTTDITVAGHPEIFCSNIQVAGNKATITTGTSLLDIEDCNAFVATKFHVRNADVCITDNNQTPNSSGNFEIYSMFNENANKLIDAGSTIGGITWYIDNVGSVSGSKVNTATYTNGNSVIIRTNPRVTITPSLSNNPPPLNTVQQSSNPYYIIMYLPCYATTSGTAGNVTVKIGISNPPTLTVINDYVSGNTSASSPTTVSVKIPPGWYYEVTATDVTLATATVVAD